MAKLNSRPQVVSEPKPPLRERKQKGTGLEAAMRNKPRWEAPLYRAADKLLDKAALITGGDSGIGRAVAILYAREGANVAITYLPAEKKDALETKRQVEKFGSRCLLISGDLSRETFCRQAVEKTYRAFGRFDILVSNAAHQNRKKSIEKITTKEFDKTFKTNIYAYFHLAKAALKFMKPGGAIIATSSETAAVAPKDLLDYSATKGAIDTFTKSLAQMVAEKGIRVNAVAPGPVWTPLNVADKGNTEKRIRKFGKSQPMKRAGQPEEIAPAYVFLASDADSSYVTGAIIAETGGLPIH